MSAQGDKVATDPGQIGIAIRALNMSRHSGDQASVWRQGDILLAVIVDGLGHGPEAEAAARTAVTYIDEHFEDPLANLLTGCDHALRESRGAAMSLARLDMANRVLSFTAIGNTRCALIDSQVLHLGGNFGIVGNGIPTPMVETHPLEPGATLVFWTDGLPETLSLIPSRVRHVKHAQAYADRLIEEFATGEDDAGVIVLRTAGWANAALP